MLSWNMLMTTIFILFILFVFGGIALHGDEYPLVMLLLLFKYMPLNLNQRNLQVRVLAIKTSIQHDGLLSYWFKLPLNHLPSNFWKLFI